MDTVTMQSLGSPMALSAAAVTVVARRLATDLASGPDPSARTGEGIEYAGSRPYQAGDSVRRLDWRTAARTGTPFTRQYESLHRVPYTIVLDTSASMRASSLDVSKLDAAHWIAAAIGFVALRTMSPVAAVGLSDGAQPRPAVREGHLLASLREIHDSDPAPTLGIGEAMGRAEVRARSTGIFVVLSDFHDSSAIPALRRASSRHDVIAVHLTDPAERRSDRFGYVSAAEAETGRPMLLTPRTRSPVALAPPREFIEAGCDLIRLATDGAFVQPLRRALMSHGQLARSVR